MTRLEAVGAGDGEGAAAYQVQQSLVALGSGGWFGRGLGAGHQKLFFLPEARTDFILPIVGEELGFLGTSTVMLLFAGLVACGLRVALGAARRDRFGFLLTFGLVFWIGLQAAGNVAVVTASVPTKGIALPFISLGGSSLVVLCVAVGLVYSVARHVDARAAAECGVRGRVAVSGGAA
jgi:cell division protein FtsW